MKERSDYFLSVTGSGNEGKLAIGLLDTDGKTPLKLGENHNHSNGTPLIDGSMNFDFLHLPKQRQMPFRIKVYNRESTNPWPGLSLRMNNTSAITINSKVFLMKMKVKMACGF